MRFLNLVVCFLAGFCQAAIAGSSCDEKAISSDGKPLLGAARDAFLRACGKMDAKEEVNDPTGCNGNTLTLKKASDGHFYVNGLLNGASLRFLIDTGASLTTVSSSFAAKAGIVGIDPAFFKTAGGKVTGSIANDVTVILGQMQFYKMRVAVNPSYTEQFGLLGQNILGKFSVSINGSVMKLISPEAQREKECSGSTSATHPDADVDVPEKMKTCNADAKGKKGDERKAFMKDCLSK